MARTEQSKPYSEFDYLVASNLAKSSSFLPIDDIQLSYSGASQEYLTIKKDAWDKLSPQAKEVIKTVTERPRRFQQFALNCSRHFAGYYLTRKYSYLNSNGKRKLQGTCNKFFPRKVNKHSASFESRLCDPYIIGLFFRRVRGISYSRLQKIMDEIQEYIKVFKFSD